MSHRQPTVGITAQEIAEMVTAPMPNATLVIATNNPRTFSGVNSTSKVVQVIIFPQYPIPKKNRAAANERT